MDDELREELPELLWLLWMGVVLFWVHDSSPGCARTYRLIDRVVPLVDRLVGLSHLPGIKGVARECHRGGPRTSGVTATPYRPVGMVGVRDLGRGGRGPLGHDDSVLRADAGRVEGARRRVARAGLHRRLVGRGGRHRRVHPAGAGRRSGRRRCAWAPRSSPSTPAARPCWRMSAATLADLAPGRFVLGIGASSPVIVEQLERHASSTSRTRGSATPCGSCARRWPGRRSPRATRPSPCKGFRLERPPETPPKIVLAALRPGMLRLAAARPTAPSRTGCRPTDVGRCAPSWDRRPS